MEGTKLFSATIFLCIILSVQSTDWNKIINTVNSHNGGWEAGLNFSPNISTEYLKTLTGTILEPNERETHPSFLDEISDDDIPAEFDSRKKWPACKSVVNQIRDQGACGSCWAVSAASTFTDRLCISKQETGENTDDYIVSSEEILSCCLVGGCRGGYLIAAWFHIKHGGTVSGGEYGSESGCKPYSIQPCEHRVPGPRPSCSKLPPVSTPKCPNKCTNEKYPIPLPKDKVYAKDYHIVKGEKDIQKAILAGGSVQTGFVVYEDFVTYKSGVYRHITGEILGGHAVRIIGWGVQKNKTKYWLVANSWNTDWGNKGFFKILRGKNECEFESSVYFGVLK